MNYLIIIIALTSVICYARMLYKKDKEDEDRMKYRELEGDAVGFDDFYYCTPYDIIVLEGIVNERACTELDNYVPLK